MKWTPKEDDLLKKLREEGYSIKEIADLMGTTYDSVDNKLKRSGIKVDIKPQPKTQKVTPEVLINLGESLVESVKNAKIELKPVKLISKYSKNKKEEISILDMSDIHVGAVNRVYDTTLRKEIETYNFEIFKKELEILGQSVIEIHSLLSHAYNLKHLYINLLGDVVTNDRVFENQVFEIDRCVGKQLWDSVGYLVNFITSMKQIYQHITLTCLVGNHGKSKETLKDSQDEPIENNFEYHLYRVIQEIFKDDSRVTVTVPNTRTHVLEISTWRHLLLHGDMFRGSGNNMESKIEKLYVNVGGFDFIDMGHFHNLHEENISDKITVKYNGGWIEKEAYTYKKYRKYSVPKQWFYGCNSKRPETWSFKIDLRVHNENI